mmetsp:Transcript_14530/g.41788  ORF Transcript_14530/g.41788 Transcript_14530/m.41788 type:complete len:231 (+) Transcript_14530:893-1585(+)
MILRCIANLQERGDLDGDRRRRRGACCLVGAAADDVLPAQKVHELVQRPLLALPRSPERRDHVSLAADGAAHLLEEGLVDAEDGLREGSSEGLLLCVLLFFGLDARFRIAMRLGTVRLTPLEEVGLRLFQGAPLQHRLDEADGLEAPRLQRLREVHLQAVALVVRRGRDECLEHVGVLAPELGMVLQEALGLPDGLGQRMARCLLVVGRGWQATGDLALTQEACHELHRL